ncbi:MAG: ankyrin repeat domain-containing protein [Gemmatimonadetes bacterium]|nr:ankyrin repeat domain-containing protein [Gemmatimonadota bacterium]
MLLAAPAPESPVADAAQRGDLETVRTLLQQGADVNAAQGDGMTALHWAAKNGDVAMLRVLLYAGANREAATRLGGYTPLHLASQEGASDAVRMLLEAGSNATAVTSTGASAIHFAAAAGQPDAIKALLERGANVNARDAYAGRTPLMFAAAGGRLEAMKTLLNAGADPSAATHVVDYAERSRADDVERRRRARLIAAAKEPGERERSGASGAAGEPPLQRAQAPDPDSATAPREQRRPGRPQAEPDSPTAPDSTRPGGGYGPRPLSYEDWVGRQGGLTALHYAARDGRMEAVRLLQDAGADIDQVTLGDHTSPLLIAVINGNYDLALQLLERGADPTLASEDGAAPLFATVNCEWALRTWYPHTSGTPRTTRGAWAWITRGPPRSGGRRMPRTSRPCACWRSTAPIPTSPPSSRRRAGSPARRTAPGTARRPRRRTCPASHRCRLAVRRSIRSTPRPAWGTGPHASANSTATYRAAGCPPCGTWSRSWVWR